MGVVNRLALNDAGGNHLYSSKLGCLYGTFAVNRRAGSIYDTAKYGLSHRDLGDPARSFYNIPFFDMGNFSENSDTHIVGFQIENHAENSTRKFQ